MPIKLKYAAIGGGSWITVADGKVALKSGAIGGGTWIRPSFLKLSWSAIGGGSWIDSDYRGYPAEPTGLAVNSWTTHDAVNFRWTAGAGGAAVTAYEVMIRTEAGTAYNTGAHLVTKTDTASPSVDFTEVLQNTKYNVYIRSKSAAGLYSDWVGPLQIKMGKDAVTTTSTATGTRAYSKAANIVGYKDAPVGPTIPTNVTVQSIRYQITNSFTSAMSPYNNREIRRRANSANAEQFSWLVQTIDTTVNVADYVSNGGVQGLICLGAGWGSSASSSYVVTGTITVNGTETYTYTVTNTVPAVANSYW